MRSSCRAVVMVICLLPALSFAEDIRLLSIGLRAGFSGASVLGKEHLEHFQQYDVMANFALPWGWYSESGWGIGTRFMSTVGALRAAGDTAFITTFVPGIALGDKRGRISLEIGGGGALLSQHKFGAQDMGGPFQFAWDTALRLGLTEHFGMGYCFQHISDATIYGSNGRGYDLHMVEIAYRF
jgi:lipid A 3-O-deacylase PagL